MHYLKFGLNPGGKGDALAIQSPSTLDLFEYKAYKAVSISEIYPD